MSAACLLTSDPAIPIATPTSTHRFIQGLETAAHCNSQQTHKHTHAHTHTHVEYIQTLLRVLDIFNSFRVLSDETASVYFILKKYFHILALVVMEKRPLNGCSSSSGGGGLALVMASRGNRHCANCIIQHSVVPWLFRQTVMSHSQTKSSLDASRSRIINSI